MSEKRGTLGCQRIRDATMTSITTTTTTTKMALKAVLNEIV
ncbi:hypothetical protein [uncultured Thiodictyon sp.]|nr:hypothetical protein [uncultured Thiodictyon sp.]